MELQWGRSGEGAEDATLISPGGNARPALQWGRSGEGAEDAHFPVDCRQNCSSFNGAAPVKERKTPVPQPDEPPGSRLQWGRSGEGAEDDEIRRVHARAVEEASMGPLR